ncbi:MarR family transcriptional regulator [Enterovibrio makurazakiensis]|uniref:MarR family transcriptional regulator n=1 Tax=Enterovibrio gelatinilyticus TaxID=2899819 RepID=A0ABT5R3B1_9GAMM|nr:MarR family transcriptional regulator [Enterovibrio sp. ZSDZ42]MDD1794739.1 MarR family transcriptional regulator [Enterovibrio sp. ZSDZ42]
MKISHKRKVQGKLQKHIKAVKSASVASLKKEKPAKAVVAAKPAIEPKTETAPKVVASTSLTPKQQQVLDIVRQNAEGLNPKGIGLAAGQEEAKAASWASAALKKLAEEGVVERLQVGSKVLYKAL